jgi:drug/metabolite transporter (DMT)-like permease
MTTQAAAPSRNDPFGYGLAVAGAILFSTKGIFIKLAYAEGVSTEMLLSLRMLVALPVYLVILGTILRRRDKLVAALTPKVVLTSMAIGILGYYLSSYLDFIGLAYVSAQYERLVLFTYPFFVLLFGVWFFGDRMVWRVVPAMLVSYGGLLVIFGWNLAVDPEGLVVGTLFVLGSAITFALYQHLAKRQMLVIGTGLFTCIGMSTAGVCAIVQNLVLSGPASYLTLTPQLWAYGLALGVLGTVLPSFLMNAGMARIGARATSSTAAFGPVVTIVFAVIVLAEPFTAYHAIGTGLVLLGSVLFTRAERRARDAFK